MAKKEKKEKEAPETEVDQDQVETDHTEEEDEAPEKAEKAKKKSAKEDSVPADSRVIKFTGKNKEITFVHAPEGHMLITNQSAHAAFQYRLEKSQVATLKKWMEG